MPGQQQHQNMYGGQQPGMQGWQQGSLSEQDYGHFVLNELKRVTREYVTAALESANPQIRQTFQSLAQKSLDDQARLFQVLQQAHGYGDIPLAQQQDVQRELQQMSQKASKLQSLLEHTIGSQMDLFQEQWQSHGAGQQQSGAGYMMAGPGSQTEQGAFAQGAAYGSAMDHAGAAQGSAGYAGSKSAKESANVFAANTGAGTGNTGAGGAYRGTQQQTGSQPGGAQQGNTQATSYLM
jgi:spore coat protein CotF